MSWGLGFKRRGLGVKGFWFCYGFRGFGIRVFLVSFEIVVFCFEK